MLNIFLAYLIDNFKFTRENHSRNFEVKENLDSIINIGLAKHRKELIIFHQRLVVLIMIKIRKIRYFSSL